jgi:hypothetical protein
MDLTQKTRYAGILLLTGMVAGIFSVAPAIDSTNYLALATTHSNEVIIAAIFQFIMSLAYIGIAILLYPIIIRFSGSLSIGFLSLRIIAVSLSIIGTLLLLSTLTLSEEFIKHSPLETSHFEAFGNILKIARDYINHVFMVLVLCTGNFMLYILFIKSKLIPKWLPIWGIISIFLSAIASMLVLFRSIDIITSEYLLLNASTAIQELTLGIWLVLKGFDKRIINKTPKMNTTKITKTNF